MAHAIPVVDDTFPPATKRTSMDYRWHIGWLSVAILLASAGGAFWLAPHAAPAQLPIRKAAPVVEAPEQRQEISPSCAFSRATEGDWVLTTVAAGSKDPAAIGSNGQYRATFQVEAVGTDCKLRSTLERLAAGSKRFTGGQIQRATDLLEPVSTGTPHLAWAAHLSSRDIGERDAEFFFVPPGTDGRLHGFFRAAKADAIRSPLWGAFVGVRSPAIAPVLRVDDWQPDAVRCLLANGQEGGSKCFDAR